MNTQIPKTIQDEDFRYIPIEDFKIVNDSQNIWVSDQGIAFDSQRNKNKNTHIGSNGQIQLSYKCKDGMPKIAPMRNLVWEAFNGTIPEDMRVSFKDGNKLNIKLNNLFIEIVPHKKILRLKQERILERVKKANSKFTSRTVEETEAIISLDGEIWKTVSKKDEFNGWRISNFGRVHNNKKLKLMVISIGTNGYSMIARHNQALRIHREVALAFLGNPPDDSYTVNHKDGNKRNNHVNNLEWATQKENVNHAHKIGLSNGIIHAPVSRGKKVRKLTDDKIELLLQLSKSTSTGKLATIFDVNENTVLRIIENNGYITKPVDLLYDTQPYNKSLCLSISEELKDSLVEISNEIKHPLTEIFRHALIMFVESMKD